MVDTGAQHSVLTQTTGPLSKKTIWVEGATGAKRYRWTTSREVQLASGKVTHTFLHVPDCPYPLLGRDLLTKLGAHIYFENKGAKVTDSKGTPIQVLTLKLEDEYRLHHGPHPVQTDIDQWLSKYPDAWAETGGMGLAIHQPPLIIELKATATPVAVKQYPMTAEARQGIRPHIKRLLEQGILIPCRSAWNTPLLPVKKPGSGDYRPVQDLREINKRVEHIPPTVPIPYNLLSTLSPSHTWYSVLDLKDAFFCLKLHHQSQPLFTFEWKDSDLGISGQLTWTRLPQGFKNSPTLFDEALHQDLTAFRTLHPHLILLQYVDDILLAAETREECLTDRIQFGAPVTLNPATLLPVAEGPDSQTDHDCLQVLAEVFGTRPDLSDQPLEGADYTWYTDGSSFLAEGKRRAGAAVTLDNKVIWAEPLPEGTSAQKAELVALTQALRLAEASMGAACGLWLRLLTPLSGSVGCGAEANPGASHTSLLQRAEHPLSRPRPWKRET
ncbi:uncharacterized protein LOC115069646 [Nannospalax galili]|uniref:uncharacterized protein LOC115069646 n=1 Tax=Nannospalax galili TaxID=1026970 RepID=UPI00111C56EA|nr:uncharacterized protein LOC115069646 [Nannospalax galili]